LFQIAFRGNGLQGNYQTNFEGRGKFVEEFLVLIRFGATQLMVDVEDYKLDLKSLREADQDVEERDRVRAARNGDANALAGRGHIIAGEDFSDPVGKSWGQNPIVCGPGAHKRIPQPMHINEPLTQAEIHRIASGVQLLLMDVDGVMTDGRLYLLPDAEGNMVETKGFDSQDGIALQWMNWNGIKTGVISGRNSPATRERARQVKMAYVYQGHIEKIPILEEILRDAKITPEQVAYVGDDLTDVVIMRRVGLAIATANARKEVKRSAHLVTEAVGGSGAVREVCELLLEARGAWAGLLKKYEVTV
jgi:3-deoxy-D-manno-octulosonate 8-phosphate phosphatase (KDO 8-P phosphatase)